MKLALSLLDQIDRALKQNLLVAVECPSGYFFVFKIRSHQTYNRQVLTGFLLRELDWAHAQVMLATYDQCLDEEIFSHFSENKLHFCQVSYNLVDFT